MEHMTELQKNSLIELTGLLTAEELVEFAGDLLGERGIAHVIWTVRDFVAEIKAEFPLIPGAYRVEVAQRAYLSSIDELSDTRGKEVMQEAIGNAWHDLANSVPAPLPKKAYWLQTTVAPQHAVFGHNTCAIVTTATDETVMYIPAEGAKEVLDLMNGQGAESGI